MAITFGPKRGLVINGVLLDTWDVSLRALLRAFDQGLVISSVISRTLTAPPGSPANGDAYIVGVGATGAWATHDLAVAVWTTDNPVVPLGEWEFYVPADGWLAWSVADAGFYSFAAGAWAVFGGGGGGAVTSVAGRTGAVVLAEADITGLVADLATLAAAIASGIVNPMTTAGDLIAGGVAGALGRLGIGSTGQVLTVVSGAPAWAASGGGGGGIAASKNVVLLPVFSSNNNYMGFTVFAKLGSKALVLNPTTWQFSFKALATGGTLGAAVVYRTLRDSTTIVDSTTVLFSGSGSITTIPIGETVSDSIALAMDMTHDYYIAIYFPSAGGAVSISNWSSTSVVFGTPVFALVTGGYSTGDATTLTGGGSIPALSTVECILSQVLALT